MILSFFPALEFFLSNVGSCIPLYEEVCSFPFPLVPGARRGVYRRQKFSAVPSPFFPVGIVIVASQGGGGLCAFLQI